MEPKQPISATDSRLISSGNSAQCQTEHLAGVVFKEPKRLSALVYLMLVVSYIQAVE